MRAVERMPGETRVVGLMSGTSVDAIDVAVCGFAPLPSAAPHALGFRLLAHAERPYPPALRRAVLDVLPRDAAPLAALTELGYALGEAFGVAALETLDAAGLAPADIDLVASHGQTLYHQVAPGHTRSTWQAGEPAVIAHVTERTVVSGFRAADIAAGGQGAPLAPFLDALLLADPERTRAAQNVGGVANVTFLPAGAGSEGATALDTGPGNALLDAAARRLSGGALECDRDGALARAGAPDEALLRRALAHPYYALPPPKSTGRELFGDRYAGELLGWARERGLSPADTMATLAALTARSIAEAYRRWGPPRVDELIVSGGGAENPALMDALRAALPPETTVMRYDELGLFPGSVKEAVLVALLGHECVWGRPANLPRCTGALRRTVLGSLTPGANYRELARRAVSERGDACTPTRTLRFLG